MKKLLFLFLVATLSLPLDVVAESLSVAPTTSVSTDTARRRKGFHKKRGFMWGLFRKKNACGCPNH
jgi:hypothetical protein